MFVNKAVKGSYYLGGAIALGLVNQFIEMNSDSNTYEVSTCDIDFEKIKRFVCKSYENIGVEDDEIAETDLDFLLSQGAFEIYVDEIETDITTYEIDRLVLSDRTLRMLNTQDYFYIYPAIAREFFNNCFEKFYDSFDLVNENVNEELLCFIFNEIYKNSLAPFYKNRDITLNPDCIAFEYGLDRIKTKEALILLNECNYITYDIKEMKLRKDSKYIKMINDLHKF